jgi:hypothetical protein
MGQLPNICNCTVEDTFFLLHFILCLPKLYPGEDDHQTGHTDLLVHCTGAALENFQQALGYRKHDVCPVQQHCGIICVLCG